jgi:hypothetical protein
MARLNLEIPEALKRQAKIKAAQQQKTLTNVIGALLQQWLDERDRASKQKRLAPGLYKLGAGKPASRRKIYEDLS